MGLSKFVFQKLWGWKVEGRFDPDIKKAVVIVAPHTSWVDFIVGLFARRIVRTKIHWLGKKELFVWPFSYYFKWTGGTPLDRTPGQDKVQYIASLFLKKEEFRLALAPEGTRKKVEKWRTGFYYIASEANVPIIRVGFDYASKKVCIAEPFYTRGTLEVDLPKIQSFFQGMKGKNPEKG